MPGESVSSWGTWGLCTGEILGWGVFGPGPLSCLRVRTWGDLEGRIFLEIYFLLYGWIRKLFMEGKKSNIVKLELKLRRSGSLCPP